MPLFDQSDLLSASDDEIVGVSEAVVEEILSYRELYNSTSTYSYRARLALDLSSLKSEFSEQTGEIRQIWNEKIESTESRIEENPEARRARLKVTPS